MASKSPTDADNVSLKARKGSKKIAKGNARRRRQPRRREAEADRQGRERPRGPRPGEGQGRGHGRVRLRRQGEEEAEVRRALLAAVMVGALFVAVDPGARHRRASDESRQDDFYDSDGQIDEGFEGVLVEQRETTPTPSPPTTPAPTARRCFVPATCSGGEMDRSRGPNSSREGRYDFHCSIHPEMQGTLPVSDAFGTDPDPRPRDLAQGEVQEAREGRRQRQAARSTVALSGPDRRRERLAEGAKGQEEGRQGQPRRRRRQGRDREAEADQEGRERARGPRQGEGQGRGHGRRSASATRRRRS